MEKIESSIGYVFKNKNLLKKALTHTSYAYENHIESNEKLEFLGDSILEFVSSKYIYTNYPHLKEGEMTKVRAEVVCEDSLYLVAQKHHFSDFLYLGKSEAASHGNTKPTILADSVEAVIAAIYFDSGLEQAEKFIIENLKEAVEESSKNVGKKDHKTVLQEKLQENGTVHIKYDVIKTSGPDHNKTFTVQVFCNENPLAIGEGKTKKQAEMEAAQKALEKIK
ncbi:MAG: ribonuclease III [Clostridia bacterium]